MKCERVSNNTDSTSQLLQHLRIKLSSSTGTMSTLPPDPSAGGPSNIYADQSLFVQDLTVPDLTSKRTATQFFLYVYNDG